MMPMVFISYRQVDDAQRQRVRAFGERLRGCGIEVVLDQFHVDDHAEGPHEKWPKWSSDRARTSERVIIIGTRDWFACFDGTQPPGTGLGAACEADAIRTRIYESANKTDQIRVVIFDNDDARHISPELKGWHYLHAERDFTGIVRWLGGTMPSSSPSVQPVPKIPNNLPRLQPFFGRTAELKQIADALDPESRTWGTLIDGPGGMGKTSLAIRAAYECEPGQFDRIIFLSVKDRELDDDGVRKLTGFVLLPAFLEMLNELARELGQPDITKAPEDQRIRLLLDALRPANALLILDNLESLGRDDRDQLFTFVKRLPQGCKAILTSRRLIGSSSDLLILKELDEGSALETLADLAKHNPLLAKTNEAERLTLYTQTGGNPLLLRWVAGQLGRGSCRTFTDALHFLRSCPPDNDPLEFVFGDLATEFTPEETRVLAALTYFTLSAKVEHIAQITELATDIVETALRTLANRSLVVPDAEERAFKLVPMVAEFLRRSRPDVVVETGNQLEERAYELIMENGSEQYDRLPILDAAWPTIASALPRFIAGANARLQTVCSSLDTFLDFTGHWDERLSLSRQAETKAVAEGDYRAAGYRAYRAGWVHYFRRESDAVLELADRAATHWQNASAGDHERSLAIGLRGVGHELKEDYTAAIASYRKALELGRAVQPDSANVAATLNNLAGAMRLAGDHPASDEYLREALRVARAVGHEEGIATFTCNLAGRALEREEWPVAEALAREALVLAERFGRLDLIATDSRRLATALLRQGNKADALPFARRAVEIETRLRVPSRIGFARDLLEECES